MISINFIGRKEELNILNSFYKKKGFQNIVIYGRRRIGKTTLSLEFLKDKKGVYFLSEKNDFIILAQRLVDKFSAEKNIFPRKVKDFYEAFEFILENLKNERYIIIIDEFPYLVEENKSILSHFQRIIDELLLNSNLYLILLGSSISIMENEVLGYSSPLYARRTGQLKIMPLKFEDLFQWFKNKSIVEIIEIYSIVDSIPLYLNKIDKKKYIFENIYSNFYRKGEFLYEEIDFLLNSELRETKNYKRILEAIANGKNRLSEIANETHISVNVLTNYIDTLLNLHIIKKEYPITDKKELSRNSIYKFEDNYFNFWFSFIFKNIDLIEENKEKFLKEYLNKKFNKYVSFVFEDVCRKVININYSYQKVGTWWHKGEEIDICGIWENGDLVGENGENNQKRILFGECKWQDNINGVELLKELEKKTTYVKWFNNERKEEFVLFGKSFKTKPKNCKCYDLKSIEKVFKSMN